MEEKATQKSNKRIASGAFLLAIVGLGTFSSSFANGSTNLALPILREFFNITVSQSTIITISFSLVGAILTLPLGRIGDLIGYKKMYVGGLIASIVGTILTGLLARSMVVFIAFRAIMALGNSMIMSVTQALLQKSFPPEKRGQIMGINSAMLSASGLISPLLGGVILDNFNWMAVYFATIPIAVIVLILVLIFMEDFKGTKIRIDYGGALLLIVFLSSLMLVLNGRVLKFNATLMIALGVICVIGLLLFILRERKCSFPLIDLKIFKYKRFTLGNIAFFIGYATSGIVGTSLTYYINYTRGYTSTITSLFVMIHGFMMAIMASFTGTLSDKIGPLKLSIAGAFFQTAGLLGYALAVPITSSDTFLVIMLFVFGFGSGLFYAPTTSMVMGAIPVEMGGVASGTMSTMRNVGGGIGTTFFSLMIAGYAAAHAAQGIGEAESYCIALQRVQFISAAAFFIAMCLMIYLYIDDKKKKKSASA